jgi:hypothetical protein
LCFCEFSKFETVFDAFEALVVAVEHAVDVVNVLLH